MQSQNLPPVNAWKHPLSRVAVSALIALTLCTAIRASEPIEVFRTGDELIVKLDRFDLLREANIGLIAELKLQSSLLHGKILHSVAD